MLKVQNATNLEGWEYLILSRQDIWAQVNLG